MAGKQRRRQHGDRKRRKRLAADTGDGALVEQAARAHEAGDLTAAARCYRRVLRSDPHNGELWHRLGGILYQLDKTDSAIEALEKAVGLSPDASTMASDLGGLYLSLGRFDDAERAFVTALRIAPASPGARYNLSIALYSQGRVAESISHLTRLVAAQPDFAEAHHNLGVAFRAEGMLSNAISALEKALALQADNTSVMLELARAYREFRSVERALVLYRSYLDYRKDLEALVEYGELLHDNGETKRALETIEKAVAENPNDAMLTVCLGRLRHNAGDLEGAERVLRDGLRVNPDNISAVIGLSRVRRITDPDDELLAVMRGMLGGTGGDELQRAALHYSVAKICDDLARYDEAFEHYRLGSEINRRQYHYDRAKMEATHSRVIEVFDRATIDELSELGSDSDVPLLIVGMPRSGTSLVEQVISSHPMAAGAGELRFFSSLAQQLPNIVGSELPFPDCIHAIDGAAADKITTNYVDLLRRHSSDARKISDKLPGNYINIGLFRGLFPNGRIISCRRDPLDVALSIYFQYFGEGHEYAWNLDDIAHRYGQYERVRRHWAAVLPGVIQDIQYEEMIVDFETTARRLIAYCGLDWDDDCLAFYQTKRDVRTASNWQVRQPIYKRSLARWEHYRHHIGPLIEALQPFR